MDGSRSRVYLFEKNVLGEEVSCGDDLVEIHYESLDGREERFPMPRLNDASQGCFDDFRVVFLAIAKRRWDFDIFCHRDGEVV